MKTFQTNALLFVTFAIVIWTTRATADNKTLPIHAPNITKSLFIIPSSNIEGRDPFFPESTRAFEAVMAASQTNRTAEITSLKVPGISGESGHLLAIINNHTFAVGDEGDVLTVSGRVHLHCVEIQPTYVVVEVNGQKHRINLGKE